MKPFESFLAPELTDYLRYRRSLGYDTQGSESHLLIFDRYLRKVNAQWDSLQPFFFLEMRAHLPMEPRSVNRVLSSTRVFFHYLVRREVLPHNPLRDVPLLKEGAIVPFVFSPEQTERLLQAVSNRIRKTQEDFLIDLGLYVALVLLARCGMRISEPLKLLRQHYRRDDATVFIDRTKFKKQRLVALPQAAVRELENYLSVRKQLVSRDTNPFLLAAMQGPLRNDQVYNLFRQAVTEIGLDQPRRVLGNLNISRPTPHSLRHSFAVNTLIRIKQGGQSPQSALPVLAAYLGHSEYKYTAVYLRVADAQSRKNLVDFALWQKRNA